MAATSTALRFIRGHDGKLWYPGARHTDSSATVLRLRLLRKNDAKMWFPGVTRIIPGKFLPYSSKEPVIRDNGSIFYRGVYYYSPDRDYPYVRMIKSTKSINPLIRTCDEDSYNDFLRERLWGEYIDEDTIVYVPMEHENRKMDL